ncbi:hypothetical protein SAMN02982929_04385 [Saccharopolyspora kobensis]|uniref:Uncharacterized protein n=1 Tax=Saccharopolyspora kobensis TaxID=146035 RepID=A0A1H6DG20_9PSEU|nr:ABC transporter permease [Saccharopolyspora kobensis]SEG84170.1 hypothetical protein SAMN02982929_04385 [Saccharopolyspora kobensis]SFD29423.1 hypothetical protein SAMN05216506_103406 [Saccharopolyspora kobensis]
MIRALLRELRKGAPFALVVAAGFTVLVFLQPWWAGNWNALTTALRFSVLYVGPLMAAAGTWAANREHRRGTAELLTTTTRPGWQPFLASWLALTLISVLGMVIAIAVAAFFVIPTAAPTSGRWLLTMLANVPIFGAMVAFGALLGRSVRWPLITAATPLLTFTLIVYIEVPSWSSAIGVALGPNDIANSSMFTAFSSALQAVLFSAIAVALLIAAVARRRWLALLPAGLVIAVSAHFSGLSHDQHVAIDSAGAQPVCTTSTPKVCVPEYQQPALAEVAALTQPMLRKLDGIPGAPTELRTGSGSPADEGLNTYQHPITLTGRLADPDRERELMASYLVLPRQMTCPGQDFFDAYGIAAAWLLDDRPDGPPGREWMAAYYAAYRDCDPEAIGELATTIR